MSQMHPPYCDPYPTHSHPWFGPAGDPPARFKPPMQAPTPGAPTTEALQIQIRALEMQVRALQEEVRRLQVGTPRGLRDIYYATGGGIKKAGV